MEYFSFDQLQLVLQCVSYELYRSIPIFSTDNIFTLKHLKITGYKWSNNLINKTKIFYFICTLHRKFIERTLNYPTCRANLHNFMQCTLTYKCKTSPKETMILYKCVLFELMNKCRQLLHYSQQTNNTTFRSIACTFTWPTRLQILKLVFVYV